VRKREVLKDRETFREIKKIFRRILAKMRMFREK
jgi:hypothetical protein